MRFDNLNQFPVSISNFTDDWASSILQFHFLKDLKIHHQPSIDHISDMISDSAAEKFFHDMGTCLPLLESLDIDIPYIDVSWLRYLPSSLKSLDIKVSFEGKLFLEFSEKCQNNTKVLYT